MGFPIIYTRESYRTAHGGRDPADDGVKGEQVCVPGSGLITGYKARWGHT